MRPALVLARLRGAPVARSFLARARRLACRSGGSDPDRGRAMIEVIFLAVLILIPTVYILAAVMRVRAA